MRHRVDATRHSLTTVGAAKPETICVSLTAPMADIGATFVQQIFDFSQRQRKADVHCHRKADDLG